MWGQSLLCPFMEHSYACWRISQWSQCEVCKCECERCLYCSRDLIHVVVYSFADSCKLLNLSIDDIANHDNHFLCLYVVWSLLTFSLMPAWKTECNDPVICILAMKSWDGVCFLKIYVTIFNEQYIR